MIDEKRLAELKVVMAEVLEVINTCVTLWAVVRAVEPLAESLRRIRVSQAAAAQWSKLLDEPLTFGPLLEALERAKENV